MDLEGGGFMKELLLYYVGNRLCPVINRKLCTMYSSSVHVYTVHPQLSEQLRAALSMDVFGQAVLFR